MRILNLMVIDVCCVMCIVSVLSPAFGLVRCDIRSIPLHPRHAEGGAQQGRRDARDARDWWGWRRFDRRSNGCSGCNGRQLRQLGRWQGWQGWWPSCTRAHGLQNDGFLLKRVRWLDGWRIKSNHDRKNMWQNTWGSLKPILAQLHPTDSNCPLEIPLVLKGLRLSIPSILAIELSDSPCSQQPDFEDVGAIQQDAGSEALRTSAPQNFGWKFSSSTGSTVVFPVGVSSWGFQTWLSPHSVAWTAPHLLPAEMTMKVFSASTSPKCYWT